MTILSPTTDSFTDEDDVGWEGLAISCGEVQFSSPIGVNINTSTALDSHAAVVDQTNVIVHAGNSPTRLGYPYILTGLSM